MDIAAVLDSTKKVKFLHLPGIEHWYPGLVHSLVTVLTQLSVLQINSTRDAVKFWGSVMGS